MDSKGSPRIILFESESKQGKQAANLGGFLEEADVAEGERRPWPLQWRLANHGGGLRAWESEWASPGNVTESKEPQMKEEKELHFLKSGFRRVGGHMARVPWCYVVKAVDGYIKKALLGRTSTFSHVRGVDPFLLWACLQVTQKSHWIGCWVGTFLARWLTGQVGLPPSSPLRLELSTYSFLS